MLVVTHFCQRGQFLRALKIFSVGVDVNISFLTCQMFRKEAEVKNMRVCLLFVSVQIVWWGEVKRPGVWTSLLTWVQVCQPHLWSTGAFKHGTVTVSGPTRSASVSCKCRRNDSSAPVERFPAGPTPYQHPWIFTKGCPTSSLLITQFQCRWICSLCPCSGF